MKKAYQNWQVECDKDQIVWLRLDRANSEVNTINMEVLNELAEILTEISQQSNIIGVIITSAKTSGFIAGADVEQFDQIYSKLNSQLREDESKPLDTSLDTESHARQNLIHKKGNEILGLLDLGQQVFNQLAALAIPTVAMIQGFCLGGGCELALACRYRVAEDGSKTKIGLPEVLLGIHPGWGGSVRLPRLVGAINAMDLLLSGRAITAKAAAKIGLIDFAVPERHLIQAARYCILNQLQPHEPTLLQVMTNDSFVRPLLAKIFLAKLAKKVNPAHYPAPYAVVENWKQVGIDNVSRALKLEAKSVAKLALTETAHNLLRVFFLQQRLKNLGKRIPFTAKHVHVIGAGTMGGDIAAWCALQGLRVTLQDREPKFIAPAIKRAAELFKQKLKVPRLVQQALDRLIPDVQGLGIPKADVFIEAIFENLQAKQQIFQELELLGKPQAVLATNTSSLMLDQINVVLKDRERLVGLHFFNPASKMQLVEVVRGEHTASEIFDRAMAFVRQIDRLPLPVKSYPGFLVNRILMPYLMEAMLMFEEGITPQEIDHAAVNFGMPMGPIELADVVGLDICLAVAKNLSEQLGETLPEKLVQMVKNGLLGRKTNQGFYNYKSGRPVKNKVLKKTEDTKITDRLILRIINESVACLREEVVADSDLLDAGMIFGTGFAPFRGGPMHYAQHVGLQKIYELLQEFSINFGKRFLPDTGWNTLLKKTAKPKVRVKNAQT